MSGVSSRWKIKRFTLRIVLLAYMRANERALLSSLPPKLQYKNTKFLIYRHRNWHAPISDCAMQMCAGSWLPVHMKLRVHSAISQDTEKNMSWPLGLRSCATEYWVNPQSRDETSGRGWNSAALCLSVKGVALAARLKQIILTIYCLLPRCRPTSCALAPCSVLFHVDEHYIASWRSWYQWMDPDHFPEGVL